MERQSDAHAWQSLSASLSPNQGYKVRSSYMIYPRLLMWSAESFSQFQSKCYSADSRQEYYLWQSAVLSAHVAQGGVDE